MKDLSKQKGCWEMCAQYLVTISFSLFEAQPQLLRLLLGVDRKYRQWFLTVWSVRGSRTWKAQLS